MHTIAFLLVPTRRVGGRAENYLEPVGVGAPLKVVAAGPPAKASTPTGFFSFPRAAWERENGYSKRCVHRVALARRGWGWLS